MYANTAAAQSVVDRMHAYGVQASGEVVTQEYHQGVSQEYLTLAELQAAGGQISRVRLLTENMGGWRAADISYIHATLPNGTTVHVNLAHCPSPYLTPLRKMKGMFIEWAKAEGVYAKGLGLLDESRWSVLY